MPDEMTLTPADQLRLSALGVTCDEMPAPAEFTDVTLLRLRLMQWRQEALQARKDFYHCACQLERCERGVVALKAAVIAFAVGWIGLFLWLIFSRNPGA